MYQKTMLDNGMRLVTSQMPHTRSVCIGLFTGTGSRYETEIEAGTSHFIEHLLFKGSQKRPTPGAISAAIEGVGGILNGGTDKELTVYWCKVARDHFPLALDVLGDMLLHPRFDPEELARERRVIIEEINMCKDSPSQEAGIIIDELLWPAHPLGRDIAGSKGSVNTITREAILDYYRHHYRPDNTVAVVAGNIKQERAIDAVSQAFAGWSCSENTRHYAPYQPARGPAVKIEKRDIEQAHLCLSLPGLPLLHPKRFQLDLLNVILGQGMSSRLFTEVRDRMGLAYSIHSYVEHFLDTGSLTIYAGVDTANLATAVRAIIDQMCDLREKVPEEELIRAREISRGRLLLRMEDSHNVAGWLGGQEALTGQILTPERVTSIIDAITAAEIEQLARELIQGGCFRMAVVGPVSEGEPLENLLRM